MNGGIMVLNKTIKNRIRKSHSSIWKVDRYLKLTRVELKEVNFRRELDDGRKLYRVKYNFGINIWNPLVWIFIVIPTIFIEISKVVMEILGDLGMRSYSDDMDIFIK